MGLAVLHLHLHGLYRGRDLPLGHDADTGGQTLYVHELALTQASLEGIDRVDVITRQIVAPGLSADYGRSEEPVAPRLTIRRLPFGPAGYLAKEELWPHLDALVERLEGDLRAAPRRPDWIHAHYADAGYVGARLQQRLGLPLVFSAHSLGRCKRRRMLELGEDGEAIERRFAFRRRIAAEELALARSSLVVASTQQELDQQYVGYRCFQPELARVIPPGVDQGLFHPPDGPGSEPEIEALLQPLLRQPQLAPLLALCRPDPRKNIAALVEAFGRSTLLRSRHNLVLALGSAAGCPAADQPPAAVAAAAIGAIFRYGLQGRVALLQQLPRQRIPALYRWASGLGGIFVNPALSEPFGLTLLEAAASGLPVVATDAGGPREILQRCANGLLVDVRDEAALQTALEAALSDAGRWRRWSANGLVGVRRHYSWQAHGQATLAALAGCLRSAPPPTPRTGQAQGEGTSPLPLGWVALEAGIQ
jgi:sucrose-phosphate synthase